MPMLPYERFEAWKVNHQLTLAVYGATRTWPKAELYGLVSQTRRAAFSAPMNIAEGCAKKGPREFRRYLDIALGSLSELSYCLRLARDLGYLEVKQWEQLNELRNRAGQLTWRLYRSVAKSS